MERTLINVIFTCFNRREKTKMCLETLLNQKNKECYQMRFIICDDGSTDGTSDMIRQIVQEAVIVKGTGSLYWAKGMARALDIAKKYPCDFYLMVNDDVQFKVEMLDIMFDTYRSVEDPMVAVSGATQDPDTKRYSYGGEKVVRRGLKEVSESVMPSSISLNYCDRANWNCFLIRNDLYRQIGDIDDFYAHSYADYDYSYLLIRSGARIVISKEYVGYCKRNEDKGTWRDKSLTVGERIRRLHQPNGIPIASAIHYWRKVDKKHWAIRVARPYLSIVKDGLKK